MVRLFGEDWTRQDLERALPDPGALFGIEHLQVADGPARGQRVMRIEAGAGLRVELLPDRLCDIGAVWCDGVPYFWTGPNGAQTRLTSGTNGTLYGLLQTCGFDHIRAAETVDGTAYLQHGGMMQTPARILSAAARWSGDTCVFRIEAEARQFALGTGTLRLRREVEIPLGAREIRIADALDVIGQPVPVMAMYHVNLGLPLARGTSRLHLNGADLTESALGTDAITTRPSRPASQVTLGTPGGPTFRIDYDGGAFPVLQTLRNMSPGTGLICIEPATHERRRRADLIESGALVPSPPGTTHRFGAVLRFEP
ncbi:DUF4432 family protein [Psychromarinibacter sp. C21-152]|uniref:DUF4432 family protein n=1 Tax=Psychromarinibacter sediminicola TaxID=3033385 RepID=A0AAE3NQV9_9RHOB|nr:DUF4432 family protein [Psychromarinibacter sediminicola]MDF0599999.1 DUF4432 family protein [Psychromarinibacter sediminicola]